MSGMSFLLLFGAVICIVFQSVTSTSLGLDCPRVVPNGIHLGRVVGIIDKDEWWGSNYLFQPIGQDPGCVQYDSSKPYCTKLLHKAYSLGKLVIVKVDGNHELKGIGFANN